MYQLSITLDLYQSFYNGFEIRGVSLDISKAFNKVWHKGLIYKLKQNGIAGNLLNTLSNFSTFLNIYKWLIWKFTFESRTTCLWHVPVFSNIWQGFFSKELKQWFEQDKKLGFSMENDF